MEEYDVEKTYFALVNDVNRNSKYIEKVNRNLTKIPMRARIPVLLATHLQAMICKKMCERFKLR